MAQGSTSGNRGLDSIRSFAKQFTNMNPSQQRDFEMALSELNDSLELTSLTNSLDLLQRKPDQNLPIPQITVARSVRGGVISWPALPDQKVNFYEVEISDTPNFAVFVTTSTFGTQAVLNGLTSSKYVRVRGVRKDGTTTPYSDVELVAPRLFDIEIHTQERFYIRRTPGEAFYPIARLRFTPIDVAGNSMIFGFVSLYADPEVMVYGLDDIQLRLIRQSFYAETGGVTSSEEIWKCSVGEYYGCYSVGPLTVPHPDREGQEMQFKLELRDSVQTTNQPTEVIWVHLNALELGVGG